MKAAVLRGARDIKTETVSDPVLDLDGIIIKVKTCGICGSDLHVYKSEGREGTIFGHEFSGDVAEVGDRVKDITAGERVTAIGFRACGECRWCLQGKPHRCSDMALLGYQLPGAMAEYVEQAIANGLVEIGFSDHMPVMPEPHLCMRFDELPSYVDELRSVQDKYGDKISIKLGCEMDIEFDRVGDINKILSDYDFDYVIGSIHYLNSWPFDQEQYSDGFEKEPMIDIYRRFFDRIIAGMETGLYDTVGHIDNISSPTIPLSTTRPERN